MPKVLLGNMPDSKKKVVEVSEEELTKLTQSIHKNYCNSEGEGIYPVPAREFAGETKILVHELWDRKDLIESDLEIWWY